MKATANVVLPHSIETVFSCVADITRMPLWVSNFSNPRWIPRGDLSKPPVFMGKYLFNGRQYEVAIQVAVLHPPSCLVMQSDSVPFAFTSRVELEPKAGQTHLSYSLEAGSENAVVKLFILIFGRVAGRMLKKQLEADLKVLVKVLNGEPGNCTGTQLVAERELLDN